MKTDAELWRDVMAELAWDPAVRATDVGVTVRDAIVTLTGHLQTLAEKHAAARAAQRVAGVNAVAVEIDVIPSPDQRRSDTEIAAGIEHALKWHTPVPQEAVRATVDHGRVTLEGELEWDYQRRSVEAAIRPLMGVVDIDDKITLRPQAQASNLERRIADALARQALQDARRIHVTVEGGTVKLSGTVGSLHERDAAAQVAWAAPGVHAVVDELRVA